MLTAPGHLPSKRCCRAREPRAGRAHCVPVPRSAPHRPAPQTSAPGRSVMSANALAAVQPSRALHRSGPPRVTLSESMTWMPRGPEWGSAGLGQRNGLDGAVSCVVPAPRARAGEPRPPQGPTGPTRASALETAWSFAAPRSAAPQHCSALLPAVRPRCDCATASTLGPSTRRPAMAQPAAVTRGHRCHAAQAEPGTERAEQHNDTRGVR